MAQSKIVVRRRSSALALTELDARKLHEQISGMTIELVPTDSVKSKPKKCKTAFRATDSLDC